MTELVVSPKRRRRDRVPEHPKPENAIAKPVLSDEQPLSTQQIIDSFFTSEFTVVDWLEVLGKVPNEQSVKTTGRRVLLRNAKGTAVKKENPDAIFLHRFKQERNISEYFNPDYAPKTIGVSNIITFHPSGGRLYRAECPDNEKELTFANMLCGHTLSTYPLLQGTNTRLGDPICDYWLADIYCNKVVIAVADGCGWGNNSRTAAQAASRTTVDHLSNSPIVNVQTAGHYILEAMGMAHRAITKGCSNLWEAGTTAIACGVLCQKKEDNKFVFVMGSVGDCKGYHYSAASRQVTDITFSNREYSADPSDPGGRIGPIAADGGPDLRNLELYSVQCEEGDIVFLVSDGVHDNLDPEQLGILPEQLFIPTEYWKDMSDIDQVTVKNLFVQRFFSELLDLNNNKKKLTASRLVETLIKHAQKTTSKSRLWIENNSNQKLSNDYTLFPGKLDHTTCVAFEVGIHSMDFSNAFSKVQTQLAQLQEEFRNEYLRQAIHSERQFYSLNVPLQVTMCTTATHVVLYCRTIAGGKLSVRLTETQATLHVQSGCLSELIPPDEWSKLSVVQNDEFSFPIERVIDLPCNVETSKKNIVSEYDKNTGLAKISIRKQRISRFVNTIALGGPPVEIDCQAETPL